MTRNSHASHGEQVHHGHGAHGGHRGATLRERDTASGTVASIGRTTFSLASDEGELIVATDAETNVHGLSRRRAREAGYEDPAASNTFATLKVGQRVAVMGARQGDSTLLARRVHILEP